MLAELFRAKAKTTKDITKINEMSYSVSYPTGFLNFDFANGYIQEVNGQKRYELGISDGSLNMLIGESSVGKTSWLVPVAVNIIRPFPTSCIFYEQAEVGTNINRIKQLSGFSSDEEFSKKFIIRDSGITTESVYDRVKMIHDLKVEHSDRFMYDTGMVDMRGNHVYKFEPTVVIADSVKMILSKKNADADEATNMTGAQSANVNSNYYIKMIPLCREANIIIFLINHITTSINTGYGHMKPELPYLREGQHLPGGKSLIYAVSNMEMLTIRSKLKPEEGFCISGSIVDVDIVKSRTNKSGRSRCSIVYDQDVGFDTDLSLFLMLKENKLLEGGGAYLKMPGCETKFSQREFKKKLYSDPELYQAFTRTCFNYLNGVMLDEYARIKEEEARKGANVSSYLTILSMVQQQTQVTD